MFPEGGENYRWERDYVFGRLSYQTSKPGPANSYPESFTAGYLSETQENSYMIQDGVPNLYKKCKLCIS